MTEKSQITIKAARYRKERTYTFNSSFQKNFLLLQMSWTANFKILTSIQNFKQKITGVVQSDAAVAPSLVEALPHGRLKDDLWALEGDVTSVCLSLGILA